MKKIIVFVTVLFCFNILFIGAFPDNGDAQEIRGCVSNKTGALRILSVSQTCNTKTETLISWNQQGPAGPQGPQGPPGSSDTYTKHLPLAGEIPLNTADFTTVAELDLPAGDFVFMASAMFANTGTEEDAVYCILEPQAEGNSQGVVVVPVNVNTSLTLTVAGTRSLSTYPASLWCRSNRPGAVTVVTQFDFTAIKVATLTIQP